MGQHKHTPGPWVRVENPPLHDGARADTIYGASGGDYVADVYFKYMLSTRNAATFEANARLIAAAPDLLAALEMALIWLDYEGKYDVQGIRAAIAKATGGDA